MKTLGQKVGELIDALEYGYILYKQHGDPVFDNKEFIFKSENYYEMKGWATAFGTPKDRFMDMIKNPDDWRIFPDFNMKTDEYPYPWSIAFSSKNS